MVNSGIKKSSLFKVVRSRWNCIKIYNIRVGICSLKRYLNTKWKGKQQKNQTYKNKRHPVLYNNSSLLSQVENGFEGKNRYAATRACKIFIPFRTRFEVGRPRSDFTRRVSFSRVLAGYEFLGVSREILARKDCTSFANGPPSQYYTPVCVRVYVLPRTCPEFEKRFDGRVLIARRTV